jgi:predicted Zn-dependent peptidase
VTTASVRPETGLRRTTLPNGLTVLSEWMPGVRSVAFGAWVRSGSVHERPEVMGISHFLEHLVFKGTETRGPREIAAAIETLGGSLDAYTAREHTAYQARLLDEHLGEAVDVIGDLLFRPVMKAEDLELERGVILEEIAAVDDAPDDLVFELHNEMLWGNHPYGYRILGTRDTVGALSVEQLRELHGKSYQPDRIVIAAAGNVVHEHLLDLLDISGWTAQRGSSGRIIEPSSEASAKPVTRHVRRRGTQTQIVLGGTSVKHSDPRRFACTLVSMLMGDGMSSRLFQRIREEMGLAYAVYTYHEYYHHAGVHGVYVGAAPEMTRKATDAVRQELSLLAREGVPHDELAAAKRQLKGQITLAMEGVSSRMYRAASVELYGEPYRTLDELLLEIDRIDPETVSHVCREFFDPDRLTQITLGPSAKAS